MFFAEFATAVAGWVLGINPFDQPNVQEAKDKTNDVLDAGTPARSSDADDDALRELLDGGAAALPGDPGLRRAHRGVRRARSPSCAR